MAFDPNNPADLSNGFPAYLMDHGWDGQGMPWQYAQQLRAQGQHPRWDYRHPGQAWPGVQNPVQGGLGQLAGQWHMPQMQGGSGYDGSGINPGGSYQNPTAPRPMNPMQNGLMDLARRRPGGFVQA